MSTNISLRKGTAIQLLIVEAMKEIPFKTNITISMYENPIDAMAKVQTEFNKNNDRYGTFAKCLTEIRTAVGKANVKSGVHELLTKIATLDRTISKYSEIYSSMIPCGDVSVIENKLIRMLESTKPEEYSRYNVDYINTGVFSADDIKNFGEAIKVFKQTKQKYADSLMELNIKTQIALTDEVVEFLTIERIL